MKKMQIIGLTGPSGAGKGLLSSHLIAHGVVPLDTDTVYHRLLLPPSDCLDELTSRFGTSILRSDGTLHRPALAAVVFAEGHEQDREDLNRITHRYVLNEVRRLCRALALTGCPTVLVDAPLLFESGFDKECDHTLAVLADRDVRIKRIMARDHLTREAAEARMAAQKPDIYYIERAEAIIRNDTDPSDMSEALLSRLRQWGVIPL